MCAYGRGEREAQAFEKLIQQHPTGTLAIVADSYDFWNVMTAVLPRLKEAVMAREGKIVIRPDSGNPEHVLLGDPDADPASPQGKGIVVLLDEIFGHTVNGKGFRVLDPHVGVIYGDGMYYERIERVLAGLRDRGYASSSCAFGVGGILLQNHSRDDMGFAFKATRCVTDGRPMDVVKDPLTDVKKRSHAGLIRLTEDFRTEDRVSEEQEATGLLKTVFKDGEVVRCTWEEVVARMTGIM
jgi:nicotinamide phosphoribosyltransferase